MAIVNRDLDASQQKETFNVVLKTVINNATLSVAVFPYPCTIDSIRTVCNGISGAPTALFFRSPAAGITLEAIGTTGLVPSLGVSGVISSQSFLVGAGSTLLSFPANGVLTMISGGGTGAAADAVLVQVVVKKVQEIVAHNGSSS